MSCNRVYETNMSVLQRLGSAAFANCCLYNYCFGNMNLKAFLFTEYRQQLFCIMFSIFPLCYNNHIQYLDNLLLYPSLCICAAVEVPDILFSYPSMSQTQIFRFCKPNPCLILEAEQNVLCVISDIFCLINRWERESYRCLSFKWWGTAGSLMGWKAFGMHCVVIDAVLCTTFFFY